MSTSHLLTATCIYCCQTVPLREFSKEHVLPRLLGRFMNNLTLVHQVCGSCNAAFSKTIEQEFSRNSLEAVLRHYHKVADPERAELIRRETTCLDWSLPDNLGTARIALKPAPDGTRVRLSLLPQVGFRESSYSQFSFVLEEQLADESFPLPHSGRRNPDYLILCEADGSGDRLRQLLYRRGLRFEQPVDGTFFTKPPPGVYFRLTSLINDSVFRVIAKVAFNYLARTSGSDFALHSSFDPLRRFIRYGERPVANPVSGPHPYNKT